MNISYAAYYFFIAPLERQLPLHAWRLIHCCHWQPAATETLQTSFIYSYFLVVRKRGERSCSAAGPIQGLLNLAHPAHHTLVGKPQGICMRDHQYKTYNFCEGCNQGHSLPSRASHYTKPGPSKFARTRYHNKNFRCVFCHIFSRKTEALGSIKDLAGFHRSLMPRPSKRPVLFPSPPSCRTRCMLHTILRLRSYWACDLSVLLV